MRRRRSARMRLTSTQPRSGPARTARSMVGVDELVDRRGQQPSTRGAAVDRPRVAVTKRPRSRREILTGRTAALPEQLEPDGYCTVPILVDSNRGPTPGSPKARVARHNRAQRRAMRAFAASYSNPPRRRHPRLDTVEAPRDRVQTAHPGRIVPYGPAEMAARSLVLQSADQQVSSRLSLAERVVAGPGGWGSTAAAPAARPVPVATIASSSVERADDAARTRSGPATGHPGQTAVGEPP